MNPGFAAFQFEASPTSTMNKECKGCCDFSFCNIGKLAKQTEKQLRDLNK